ncbi:unnamed protein product [Jaminaea pallidilutea]
MSSSSSSDHYSHLFTPKSRSQSAASPAKASLYPFLPSLQKTETPSSMEALKRKLAGQQSQPSTVSPSGPSSSTHGQVATHDEDIVFLGSSDGAATKGKYKSDNKPKTKMYFDLGSGTSAGPSGTSGPPHQLLSGPHAGTHQPPPQRVPSGTDMNKLTQREGIAIDDEALSLAPDFSRVAGMAPSERDKAIEEMMAQAVGVEDDFDPDDANVLGMAIPLMRHQVQGYRWMRKREAGRYKGGILADDMGLGKTIQALALIVTNNADREDSTMRYVVEEKKKLNAKDKKKHADSETNGERSSSVDGMGDSQTKEEMELRSKTTLIVAPVAVIRQWESEAKEKTNTGLKVFVHHGNSRAASGSALKKYDVVMTSFSTAASEYANVLDKGGDRSYSPLFKARWLRVILDEAHNIKNHKTKQAQACFALSERAHSRWCLTGTPIQNNPYEIYSLIHFLGIPPFDDFEHFKEKIGDPLKSSNQTRVNWGMKRLCVVLQTVLLRRTKETKIDGKPLLSLPDRIVEVVSSPFDNDEEQDFYRSWEDQARKNMEREGNHVAKLVLLLRLRQATSHPALVTKSVEADADAMTVGGERKTVSEVPSGSSAAPSAADDSGDELADLVANLNVGTAKCERCKGGLSESEAMRKVLICDVCEEALKEDARRQLDWNKMGSTKIRMMLRILEKISSESEGKEKTIIFSQFTSFLDLAGKELARRGYSYARYDGSMRPVEREAALDRIRRDKNIKIILISFKAGSTGLNLTCCSRVILMDLWYNPMLEEQGMDRAHRVGQTRNVYMYKVCIDETVEQRILALQEKKRELSRAALEGSKLKKGGNALSKKELMYLFNGGDEVPAEPVKR